MAVYKFVISLSSQNDSQVLMLDVISNKEVLSHPVPDPGHCADFTCEIRKYVKENVSTERFSKMTISLLSCDPSNFTVKIKMHLLDHLGCDMAREIYCHILGLAREKKMDVSVNVLLNDSPLDIYSSKSV